MKYILILGVLLATESFASPYLCSVYVNNVHVKEFVFSGDRNQRFEIDNRYIFTAKKITMKNGRQRLDMTTQNDIHSVGFASVWWGDNYCRIANKPGGHLTDELKFYCVKISMDDIYPVNFKFSRQVSI